MRARPAMRTGVMDTHTPAAPRRARPPLWPYLLLAALAAAFCGRALFTGKALLPLDMTLRMAPWRYYAQERFPQFERVYNPMLDPVQQYYPWRHYAVSELRAGRIPLWNPHAFAGTPFLANLQSALFYPPNLLFLVLPLWLAFTLGAALHLFMAGASMYGLCRAWRAGPAAALVGGAAWMLNGYTVAWLEYPAYGLWVVLWLPLALLLLDKALAGRAGWLGLLGLVIGTQFLGGQLQLSIYLCLAVLLYAVVRGIAVESSGEASPQPGALPGGEGVGWSGDLARRRLRPLGYALVGLALGGLVAAGQVLPTMELAPRSHRPAADPAAIQSVALPWTHLATLAVPKLFGSPADYNYWGSMGRPINYIETAGYAGLVTLALAALALPWWRRRPAVAYLAVLAAISLLLALGTPLYLALFYLVPGFKQLAGLARVLYLWAFAIAGLGALGTQRLLEERARLWPALVAGAGWLTFATAVFGFYAPQLAGVAGLEGFDRYIHVQLLVAAGLLVGTAVAMAMKSRPAVAGSLLVALVTADLFLAGFTFNPATDRAMAYFPTNGTRYLQQHVTGRLLSVGDSFLDWLPPNTPTVFGLRDIQGSDSLWWGRYLRLLQAANPQAPGFAWPNLDSPVLDLLAVSHLASTMPVEDADWQLEALPDLNVYRHRSALPEAFTVGRWRPAGDEETLAVLGTGRGWRPDTALLPPGVALPGAAPGGPLRPQRLTRLDPQRLRVEVADPRPTSLLVVSEPAYPGWQVRVDGRPVARAVADYLFLAVPLAGPGSHVVELAYQPQSCRLGLFLGLLGVALAVGLAVGGGRRHA